MKYCKILLICIIVLVLTAVFPTNAQVTRIIHPHSAYPNETVFVTLMGNINKTVIYEKIPDSFKFLDNVYTTSKNITYAYNQNNKTIIIYVNNVSGQYYIYYQLQASKNVGEYHFEGYYIYNGSKKDIEGPNIVYVVPPPLYYGIKITVESPDGNITMNFDNATKLYWDSQKIAFVGEYKNKENITIETLFTKRGTYIINFKDFETGNTVFKKIIDNQTSATFDINIPSDLPVGLYYITITDQNNKILLDTLSGVLVNGRFSKFILSIYAPISITLSLKNPTAPEVAYGDDAIIEVTTENIPIGTPATITLTGPMPNKLYYSGTWSTNPSEYSIPDRTFTIIIRTIDLFSKFNGTYGTYTLDIKTMRTIAEIDFTVVEPDFNATISSKPRLTDSFRVGQTLTIKCKTNVAPTYSEFDDDFPNTIFIRVIALKYLVSSEGVIVNADLTKPITEVYTAYLTIKDTLDTDTLEIPLSPSLPIGLYKIIISIHTAYGILKTKTYIINIKRPLLEFKVSTVEPDKKIDFYVVTTLHAQVPIILQVLGGKISDIFDTNKDKVVLYTDSNGEIHWITKIRKTAFGKYKIIATIINTNYSFSEILTVGRPKLSVNINKKLLIRGEDFTLTITTDYKRVLIFTDEYNTVNALWKNKTVSIGRIPFKDQPFNLSNLPNEMQPLDLSINPEDKMYVLTLYISPKADLGYHSIYVIAPLDNNTTIDPRIYPLATVTFEVCKVNFIEYPSEIILARGRTKIVKLEYNVYADFLKTYAWINILNRKIIIDNESSYSNGTYHLQLKLKPFVDLDNKVLKDSGTPDELLPVGDYTITIKVYNPKTHATETKLQLPLKIVYPSITLNVPDEVEIGQKIPIIVNSSYTDYYDNIYIIIKHGMDITINKLKIVNNTGIYNWSPMWTGTYEIYIRDTMGTLKGDISKIYDIPPTSGYAKDCYAQDDILITKTVKVLNILPTPTTIETPITSTVTPTITPTPSNITNKTNVTPTETTSPIITPPPTTTEETPGFEALLTIATIFSLARRLLRR